MDENQNILPLDEEAKVNDDDDSDSLNDERMLEDDFDANQNFNKNRRIDQQKLIRKDYIIYHEDIDNLRLEHFSGGWTKVGKNKKNKADKDESKQYLLNLHTKSSEFGFDERLLYNFPNIWRMETRVKFALYLIWLNRFTVEKQQEIEQLGNFNKSVNSSNSSSNSSNSSNSSSSSSSSSIFQKMQ